MTKKYIIISRMRRVFWSIIVALCTLGSLFVTPSVYAKPYESTSSDACEVAEVDDSLICGTQHTNEEAELYERIKNILDTVYLWIGIIAVIVIVIGGIRYMTSTGDSQKIQGAKNTIMYAIIGLIVTLMAFAITNFVIGALNGQGADGGGTVAEGGSEGSGGGGSESGSDKVEVKSISVVSKTTLTEGESRQLKVKIIPDYATERTLTFSSDKPEIASVDAQTGKITAKKSGEATITVTASNGIKKTVKVSVKELIKVSKITLNPTSLVLGVGKTSTIKAEITPSNASDKTIKWTSSNSKVATVDNNGKVKGIKEGSATITAASNNNVKATTKVEVGDKITGGEAIAQAATYLAVTVGPQTGRLFVDWPYTKISDSRAKNYIAARDSKALGIGDHNVAGEVGHFYASCDMGVAVPVRYSTVDPNYEYNGVPNVFQYLRRGAGKSKWKEVGTFVRGKDSISKLKPGDVLVGAQPHGHTFLFVGNATVRKKYPKSSADSLEAGYGSVKNASYYPHLFNLVEDSKKRTVNNLEYAIFRNVNYDKKKYKKIL